MKVFEKTFYQGRIGLCVLFTAILVLILCAASAGAEKKNLFLGFAGGEDSKSIPKGWEHIGYFGKAKNDISLIREGKRTIVHMKSLNSISALITSPDVNIEEHPVIAWRWKVDRAVGMAREHQRDRNDCAARIRVIFGKDKENDPLNLPVVKKVFKRVGFKMPKMEPPGIKIDYVWGNYANKGAVIDYPGARNHKIVMVEKGNERAGRWIWEKRNLLEDFRKFFGSEPPGILAIAVLTDTDQTNEGVEARYSSVMLMGK